MPITIEVQIVGLAPLFNELSLAPDVLKTETEAAMRQSLAAAEAAIKARTPRKTGRLFSAWRPEMTMMAGQLVGILADDVSYAPIVESGSPPHDISGRGRALMIPIAKAGGFGGGRLSGAARMGQQVAFFKRVRHPGSKGAHMATEGLAAATPDIRWLFKAAINRVLATIKGAL